MISGMAAISAVFTTLLKAGDHLVASRFVFGNTNSLLGTLQGLGIRVSLVDATDAANVRRFQQKLESLGVNATVRRRLGGDVDASCGQLRRKTMRTET